MAGVGIERGSQRKDKVVGVIYRSGYKTWKFRVQVYLEVYGVWDAVKKEAPAGEVVDGEPDFR